MAGITTKAKVNAPIDRELAGLNELAQIGHSLSAYLLYQTYRTDRFGKKNLEKADQYLRLASYLGNASAQYELAERLGLNSGNADAEKRALDLYVASAEKGFLQAQLKLGQHFSKAQDDPEQQRLAFKWYQAAAKARSDRALYNLGIMYATGRGTQRDDVKAFHAWRESADMSFGPALYQLAYVHIEGKTSPRDLVEAYKWLSLSIVFPTYLTNQMLSDAQSLSAKLREVLSPDQLKDAEQRMLDWWNTPKDASQP